MEDNRPVNFNTRKEDADHWVHECNRMNVMPHIRYFVARPWATKLTDGRTLVQWATVARLVRYDVDGGPKNATYQEASRFVGGSDAFEVAFANDHIRRLTPEV